MCLLFQIRLQLAFQGYCLLTTNRTTVFIISFLKMQMSLEESLRKEALERITIYSHPAVELKHHPINSRQCQQLQAILKQKVRQKVELVRREFEANDKSQDYQQIYQKFIQMTNSNQVQQQAICNNIQQMHQLADILMNPPSFGKDLYLYSKDPPGPLEEEQMKTIYDNYSKRFKAGMENEDNEAQQALKRAKRFVLKE